MAAPLVAFQGERGSFSEEAAYKLLGRNIKLLPCETFSAIFQSATSGRAKFCLVPIENTLAGSVYENFDLLQANNLHIVSEVSLRIVHNLIALPGTRRKDVRKVYSHPVALAQCGKFFARNPQIERITYYDTAGSVKMLREQQPPASAAIASRIAAEVYEARNCKPTWKTIAKTIRVSSFSPRPPASAPRPTRFPSFFPRGICPALSTSA